MSEHPFHEATRWAESAPGRWDGAFDARWAQGRGAYGGVVAGTFLRSLSALVPVAERPPRSLTVHFAAAAQPGPAVLTARVEKSGQRVSFVAGRITRGDGLVALATATFAAPRGSELSYVHAPMPAAPPPAAVAPVEQHPLLPAFAQFFELRYCLGGQLFAGGATPRLGGWIRLRRPLAPEWPLLSALLDAWPPGFFAVAERPHGATSVEFTQHFYLLPALAPDAQYLVEVDSRWAGDGYSEERRCLWSEDGRLLAEQRHLVAILG